jgi:transcriptional regulator with XRE-family HTH domain
MSNPSCVFCFNSLPATLKTVSPILRILLQCSKMQPESSKVLDKQVREDRINEYIRDRVRAAREDKGASQEDLARALEKSRAAISDMERGRVDVSASDLVFITNYFEKPLTYFFSAAIIDPQAKTSRRRRRSLYGIWMFRQLHHDALENVALSQITALAESAMQSDLKAQWKEARQEADKRGISLP